MIHVADIMIRDYEYIEVFNINQVAFINEFPHDIPLIYF